MSETIDKSEQTVEPKRESAGPTVHILNLDRVVTIDSSISRELISQVLKQIGELPKFNETIQRAFNDMVSTRLAVQSASEILQASFAQQQQVINTSLMSLFDSRRMLEGLFKAMQPAIEAARISLAQSIAKATSGLEAVRKYLKQEEETAEAFLYAGFCMAPSMNDALIQRVVALRRENKKKLMAQTIMRYYQNNSHARLKIMVNSWATNPLFAPRIEILRSALVAHLNRQYALSIPVLLINAEGIVGDFALYYEIPTKLTNKRVFLDSLDEVPVYRMRYAIHQTVTQFVDKTLYATKDFDTLPIRSKERINRHVILHGRQINYATERNSLRVFLLLDALSALTIEGESDDALRTKRPTRKGKRK